MEESRVPCLMQSGRDSRTWYKKSLSVMKGFFIGGWHKKLTKCSYNMQFFFVLLICAVTDTTAYNIKKKQCFFMMTNF
jgi:hypothetical protein